MNFIYTFGSAVSALNPVSSPPLGWRNEYGCSSGRTWYSEFALTFLMLSRKSIWLFYLVSSRSSIDSSLAVVYIGTDLATKVRDLFAGFSLMRLGSLLGELSGCSAAGLRMELKLAESSCSPSSINDSPGSSWSSSSILCLPEDESPISEEVGLLTSALTASGSSSYSSLNVSDHVSLISAAAGSETSLTMLPS